MGRSGRWARRIGGAMVAVAIVLVGVGFVVKVLAGRSAAGSAEVLTTPGEVTLDLGRGEHGIWVEGDGSLSAYDVTIEGPDGTVEYGRYGFFGSSATLRKDGVAYRMDGDFDVDASGAHTVRIEARADGSGLEADELQVAVGPNDDFALPVASALAWLAAFALGALGVIAGALGLLLGWSSKGRASAAPADAPAPPTSSPSSGSAF